MVKNDFKNLKMVTGRVRFHYLNLFEPRKAPKGRTPKYGMCIMVSKGDVEIIDNINRAIETALQLGEEIWAEEVLNNLIIPFRDGDMEWIDKPEFEGCYFLNATSMYKPDVVDDCCRSIINPEEVYSGCYGRVAIKFFPYKKDGKLGVGCCLHNVQKLEEGERLAFRISALEDVYPNLEPRALPAGKCKAIQAGTKGACNHKSHYCKGYHRRGCYEDSTKEGGQARGPSRGD